MYFEDLSEYQYLSAQPLPRVRNIGWIGPEAPFSVGPTSEEFRSKLIDIFLRRGEFDVEVNLCRGEGYVCHLCGAKEVMLDIGGRRRILGASEIWLPGRGGIYFAAPSLVIHYVLEHNYLPPAVYVQAVLDLDVAQAYSAKNARYELLSELKSAKDEKVRKSE